MTLRETPVPAPLGILQLANAPFQAPGFVNAEETWGQAILTHRVAGAFVSRIIAQESGIEAGYVAGAKDLEARGAGLILSNCGLTVLYQAAIAEAVALPVLTSSLLALPGLQRQMPAGRAIGVLTYDTNLCSERLFDLIGADPAGIVVEGLNGSESFDMLARAEPRCDWPMLERDLMAAAGRLLTRAGGLSAIVVECTTFCPFIDDMRRRFGLPIFDVVWLVKAHLAAYPVAGDDTDRPRRHGKSDREAR